MAGQRRALAINSQSILERSLLRLPSHETRAQLYPCGCTMQPGKSDPEVEIPQATFDTHMVKT